MAVICEFSIFVIFDKITLQITIAIINLCLKIDKFHCHLCKFFDLFIVLTVRLSNFVNFQLLPVELSKKDSFHVFDENKCNGFLILHHFELKSICIVDTSSKSIMTPTSSISIFTRDSKSIKNHYF